MDGMDGMMVMGVAEREVVGGSWYTPENERRKEPKNHPFAKENHLNQTSMTLCSSR